MKGKYWIILLVLIMLAVIFFPRECGFWTTADVPVRSKDCECIGIKYSPQLTGGAEITCFGLPTSYKCFDRDGLEIAC
jgi:hypothetical protein